jgi:hypothetical protein
VNRSQICDASLQELVKKRNAHRNEYQRMSIDELGKDVDPLRRVVYIACQFFDCQMVFVTLKNAKL